MGEEISPIKPKAIEIHGGAINVEVRIKVDEDKYKGAIPVSEATKILGEYLKEEYKDTIEIVKT